MFAPAVVENIIINAFFTKYKYDTKKAQNKADINLINSRKGIDVDAQSFKELDNIIKTGIG